MCFTKYCVVFDLPFRIRNSIEFQSIDLRVFLCVTSQGVDNISYRKLLYLFHNNVNDVPDTLFVFFFVQLCNIQEYIYTKVLKGYKKVIQNNSNKLKKLKKLIHIVAATAVAVASMNIVQRTMISSGKFSQRRKISISASKRR